MRIVVVGCGRVGSGVAGSLDGAGHSVTVLDRDPAAFSRLGRQFGGKTVLGVGFDLEVLEKAEVSRADAIAVVTGSDEANAVIARLASTRFRVPRVVARMYDPRQADLYRRLGVMTISPVSWGISRVVELVTLADLAITTSLGAGQVDVMEGVVSVRLGGSQVGELEIPGEAKVIAVTRGGRTRIMEELSVLETGDVVHMVVAAGAAGRVQTLLRGE
ncbi:MAG TPA: TrkA family potassium uptake protein [Acidimicrobiia bacterium]|nr:TrkA family potassium uptake protein [Acidimicrobiia bacterium]